MTTPQSLDELIAMIRRPGSVAELVLARPDPSPIRSWLGAVTACAAGEQWPMYQGSPMVGLAQLNLEECPSVPEMLRPYAFLALFLGEEHGDLLIPDGQANGDGWLLRAYKSLGELSQAETPRPPDWLRPRQLTWKPIEDIPAREDVSNLVDYRVIEGLLGGSEYEEAVGRPHDGTKLGGWPTLIQSEISWAPWNRHPAGPAYVFQVDSQEKVGLNLWDGGVLHIGLGHIDGKPAWVAETQFM
jgi:hypothetical protein